MRYLGIVGPVRSPSRTTTATGVALAEVRTVERSAEMDLLDLGKHRIQLCDGRRAADYPAGAMADEAAAMVATGGARDHSPVLDCALRPVPAAKKARVTERVLYADPGAMSDGELSKDLRDVSALLATEFIRAAQET